MTTTTIKLYDILVDKGVDRTIAREAVDEFLSREEARLTLATREDIASVRDEMRRQTMWIAVMLVGQAAAIVALQNLVG